MFTTPFQLGLKDSLGFKSEKIKIKSLGNGSKNFRIEKD
jgi:hypothetical protein